MDSVYEGEKRMSKMTLDAAIVHAKELSESQSVCDDCREEHKQLAEWLEELKQYKEEKTETNYEHFEDEIIKNCVWSFALVDGKPNQCNGVSCCNCGFSTGHGCREKIEEWLKSPYKKPVYNLTKFEKELLQCYSDIYSFKVFNSLNGMKEKGYFKGIDDNEIIGDILGKCEVIK